MIDILLQNIDNETRLKLLPKELEILKTWEGKGELLGSYIKEETAGIYLILMADDKMDANRKLSILPYYPYMKMDIIALR